MAEMPGLVFTPWHLILCFAFGLVGGFVLDLFTYRGGIELPRKRIERDTAVDIQTGKLVTFLDLGVVADMIIEGIAAIIVLRFVSPVDIVQLITTSLVAGLGGSGIIEASVNRLRAEVAGEQVRTQMERTGKVAASTKALLMKIKSREMMKAAPHAAIAQMDVELTQEIAKHLGELDQYIT